MSVPAAQLLGPERLIARRSGAVIVLVDVESGEVFELNPTAARFWEHLREGKAVDEAAAALAQEFGVAVDTVRADLDPFLKSLAAHGLLRA